MAPCFNVVFPHHHNAPGLLLVCMAFWVAPGLTSPSKVASMAGDQSSGSSGFCWHWIGMGQVVWRQPRRCRLASPRPPLLLRRSRVATLQKTFVYYSRFRRIPLAELAVLRTS